MTGSGSGVVPPVPPDEVPPDEVPPDEVKHEQQGEATKWLADGTLWNIVKNNDDQQEQHQTVAIEVRVKLPAVICIRGQHKKNKNKIIDERHTKKNLQQHKQTNKEKTTESATG